MFPFHWLGPKATVRAIQHDDGHVELLEYLDLPRNQEFEITIAIKKQTIKGEIGPKDLPVRDLGAMKQVFRRIDLYDENF